MITALIATGRLTDKETSDRNRVAAELARQLVRWSEHRSELERFYRRT